MRNEKLRKVRNDYTKIAPEFDVTRNRPWPEFRIFREYLLSHAAQPAARGRRGHIAHLAASRLTVAAAGSHVSLLDVGCGNGRLYDSLRTSNIAYTGLDNNRKLLSLAKKKSPGVPFIYGDILRLPFPTGTFDTTWCVALLHHIPSRTLQKKALCELKRVTKKGGPIMLTVWNLWQKKYREHIDARTGTALMPWGEEKKVHRYYHAFKDTELRSLISACGLSIVQKVKSDHNLAYICLNSNEKSKNS